MPLLPKAFYLFQFLVFNSSVPPGTRIGRGSRFAYGGIGCVIHVDCIIGERCVIGQGVTLGGNGNENGVPNVGNDVYISAGARILGPVHIGSRARIGANAVVLTDVPEGATAVGVPARVINRSDDD